MGTSEEKVIEDAAVQQIPYDRCIKTVINTVSELLKNAAVGCIKKDSQAWANMFARPVQTELEMAGSGPQSKSKGHAEHTITAWHMHSAAGINKHMCAVIAYIYKKHKRSCEHRPQTCSHVVQQQIMFKVEWDLCVIIRLWYIYVHVQTVTFIYRCLKTNSLKLFIFSK